MAGLENGADLDGERLAAGPALVDADPGALALQGGAFVQHATMGARAAIGPKLGLYEGVCGLFIVEIGAAQSGPGHGKMPQNTRFLSHNRCILSNYATFMLPDTG